MGRGRGGRCRRKALETRENFAVSESGGNLCRTMRAFKIAPFVFGTSSVAYIRLRKWGFVKRVLIYVTVSDKIP
ncbi:hypothetical protein Trydic_g12840 [Trypoxylus dichotomus]